jgi:NAD(P)H-dependent FMN reductase
MSCNRKAEVRSTRSGRLRLTMRGPPTGARRQSASETKLPFFFLVTVRGKSIVGSTREGRFSEKPAKWILGHLKKRDGVDPRLLDLRDFPMPFFDQQVTPATPGRPPYKNEVVQRWTAAIAQSDGFVFVTPEYNYGPSAVLKNAIDWVYPEWNRKAAGFVSYGSAMGARSVQQLRLTAIELQLAPIRSSVHIPVATLWAHYQGGDVDAGLAELEAPAGGMIDDLLWWTAAMKTARAGV